MRDVLLKGVCDLENDISKGSYRVRDILLAWLRAKDHIDEALDFQEFNWKKYVDRNRIPSEWKDGEDELDFEKMSMLNDVIFFPGEVSRTEKNMSHHPQADVFRLVR